MLWIDFLWRAWIAAEVYLLIKTIALAKLFFGECVVIWIIKNKHKKEKK